MRRLIALVALGVLLVAAVGTPAAAGTSERPEISDPCRDGQIHNTNNSTTFTPAHVDICSGWFDTTADGVKVTLELAGPNEPNGGAWYVWWVGGDCTFKVTVDNAVGAEMPLMFSAGCGPRPPVECGPLALQCSDDDYWRNVALPASSVVHSGKTLAVSVDFTGALADYAPAHRAGQVLQTPHAYATATVGPVYASSFGCVFGIPDDYCYSVNGDGTDAGADYVVGS